MISLAIAVLDRPRGVFVAQPMPLLEAMVRQRDRGGWQMPADCAFALR
jgi:hypothetical protein